MLYPGDPGYVEPPDEGRDSGQLPHCNSDLVS